MENRRMLQRVLEQVDQVILGKERENREILLAFLAGGNVLLEDIPGVGKTTLALAFSRAMGLEHRRIQFTPDVLPSDLTGFSIYRRETETFVYQPGSVFCNLLLADELNRTSPKTQSALLEVMEEGQVTVEGVTRAVPKPFLVIATQNPAGTAGTQPLPEAQVDRFLISLSLGYPDLQSELSLALSPMGKERLAQVIPVMEGKELLALQREVGGVFMKGSVGEYLTGLVRATREHPMIERGCSPRGTIALARIARASAWMAGRNFVTPQDIREQFPFVAAHRLILSSSARMEGIPVKEIVDEIVKQVPPPPMEADR